MAARTTARIASGQTTSSRHSLTSSRRPFCPTVGFVLSVPKKVPVPDRRNEHCSYCPITPAPAANMASDTFWRSDSGTNTTTLQRRSSSRGRRAVTLVSPSRRARESLMPPDVLSNAVCGE
jgi:hypothetical protein